MDVTSCNFHNFSQMANFAYKIPEIWVWETEASWQSHTTNKGWSWVLDQVSIYNPGFCQ